MGCVMGNAIEGIQRFLKVCRARVKVCMQMSLGKLGIVVARGGYICR